MGKWKTACMAAPSVLSSAVRRQAVLILAVLLLAVPVLLGGCGGQRGAGGAGNGKQAAGRAGAGNGKQAAKGAGPGTADATSGLSMDRQDGALMDDNPPYDAGDGLHLSKRAYPIVLERILDAKMPI